jgi:hypothetical protein
MTLSDFKSTESIASAALRSDIVARGLNTLMPVLRCMAVCDPRSDGVFIVVRSRSTGLLIAMHPAGTIAELDAWLPDILQTVDCAKGGASAIN